MLEELDPARVRFFEAAKHQRSEPRVRNIPAGMFQAKNGKRGNVTEIAGRLMDTKSWLSDGQMISWQAAQAMDLLVDYLDPKSEAWLV
jgi:hypothetical protein